MHNNMVSARSGPCYCENPKKVQGSYICDSCTVFDLDTTTPIDTVRIIINWGLLTILVIGIILGTCLIYRKHKGEKGLWKKLFKWNFIYILILFILWFGCSFLFWYLHGPFEQTISFEN